MAELDGEWRETAAEGRIECYITAQKKRIFGRLLFIRFLSAGKIVVNGVPRLQPKTRYLANINFAEYHSRRERLI